MILVKCPCCAGSGRVELSSDMMRTLAACSFDNWRSSAEITARVADRYVKPTAINNRLRALEAYGLLVSEHRGRPIFWKRLPVGGAQ